MRALQSLRSLDVTACLPEPLRGSQERSIFGMVSERMAAWIRQVAMDPDKIPEGPAAKMLRNWVAQAEEQGQAKGRAEGEAKGRVDALLAIFEARGLPLSEAERSRITACTDHTRLQEWIQRAVTAESAAEALS